jgi:hypothetical protein
MTRGSGARGSSRGNNSNIRTFNGPGGQFQAVRWPSTERMGSGSKTFTCHGYRTWNELALEYGIPVDEKQIIPNYKRLNNAPISTITVSHMTYKGDKVEISDSSYDSGSYSNGGASGKTLRAGESIGIGYDVWVNMYRQLAFTGARFDTEVVFVYNNGATMWRAHIANNGGQGGHNSLDLFCRTGEDKLIAWDENYVRPGLFKNPGEIYIAPYNAAVHSGIPYWGEIIGLTDDNSWFWNNMRIEQNKAGCSDQGMQFNKNDFNTSCYKSHNAYSIQGDSIYRTNVDCGDDYKGIGTIKEILDKSTKDQAEGDGAFFSYTDPEDESPPDHLVDPYKNALCGGFYSWKITGKIDLGGRKDQYDIFDPDSLQDEVDAHNELDVFQFDKGGYLYVFVFWSWAGWLDVQSQASDPEWRKYTATKVDKATSGKSFHVWKFDADDPKVKNKLFKNFKNQDVYGLNG